ncbi:DUF2185 domain-containing protein [Bremerella sp. JC817]|uniref:DUF2185 domain-containing protein n=1 Tax=Bremerella sp. JC817 TaxID=3231756 RepID=UPI003459E44B
MSSGFPYLIGRIGLTDHWSIHLSHVHKQRMEDGAMVLWRPRFTIWINAWNNDQHQSIEARKLHFAKSADPNKYDEREQQTDDGRLIYSYRLREEASDERVAALYGFVFSDSGHVQLSLYFNEESDAEIAYATLNSVNHEPPALADCQIYSQFCYASNMVTIDRIPVDYMVREATERPRDSGWQFFSGRESQEYVDGTNNIQLVPVAFVAAISPEIIPHLSAEPGTQWERRDDSFVPA